MALSHAVRRFAPLFVSIAMVAGCAHHEAPESAPQSPGVIAETTSTDFAKLSHDWPLLAIAIGAGDSVYAATGVAPFKVAAGASGEQIPVDTANYGYRGIAVDAAGNIYLTAILMSDEDKPDVVLKYSPGNSFPMSLPFTDLKRVGGVAVDAAGGIYVVDRGTNRVLHLLPGASAPTEVPFSGLNHPRGIALDGTGNVYVTDFSRVLKLTVDTHQQSELPFNGLYRPWGVAVGPDGAVFVADSENNRVLKLASGSDRQVRLPFVGLSLPSGVAVDGLGSVYVVNYGDSRILKLAKA